jgi:protein gp37
MTAKTGIEWTDKTWNPIAGCFPASPGCANCYAVELAWRWSHHPNEKVSSKYAGTVELDAKEKPVWTGKVRLVERTLLDPSKWRTPMRVFVNSMSDAFYEELSDEQIAKIWAGMALASWHDFQVLTKRAERMHGWLRDPRTPELVAAELDRLEPGTALPAWPVPNVWVGVSIEDQVRAEERLPLLLECPAAIRFVSAEPLVKPVNLTRALRQSSNGSAVDLASAGLHWVIVGGESGPFARPMHPAWARALRDECVGAGIRFFFKQVGEWSWEGHPEDGRLVEGLMPDGRRVRVGTPGSQSVLQVGTANAGKLLDGRKWQEFPPVPVPLSERKPPARKRRHRVSVAVQGNLFASKGHLRCCG